jgi:hypothetical protein
MDYKLNLNKTDDDLRLVEHWIDQIVEHYNLGHAYDGTLRVPMVSMISYYNGLGLNEVISLSVDDVDLSFIAQGLNAYQELLHARSEADERFVFLLRQLCSCLQTENGVLAFRIDSESMTIQIVERRQTQLSNCFNVTFS